jgi:hypothetical protein
MFQHGQTVVLPRCPVSIIKSKLVNPSLEIGSAGKSTYIIRGFSSSILATRSQKFNNLI